MDMLNINEIKAGDFIKLKPNLRGFIFSNGSEYRVLHKSTFGKYIVGDDGTACLLTQLDLSDWVKVEKQSVEQPKTINLSLLKEQISIISDKYEEESHLDLLIQFINGYERGLNK